MNVNLTLITVINMTHGYFSREIMTDDYQERKNIVNSLLPQNLSRLLDKEDILFIGRNFDPYLCNYIERVLSRIVFARFNQIAKIHALSNRNPDLSNFYDFIAYITYMKTISKHLSFISLSSERFDMITSKGLYVLNSFYQCIYKYDVLYHTAKNIFKVNVNKNIAFNLWNFFTQYLDTLDDNMFHRQDLTLEKISDIILTSPDNFYLLSRIVDYPDVSEYLNYIHRFKLIILSFCNLLYITGMNMDENDIPPVLYKNRNITECESEFYNIDSVFYTLETYLFNECKNIIQSYIKKYNMIGIDIIEIHKSQSYFHDKNIDLSNLKHVIYDIPTFFDDVSTLIVNNDIAIFIMELVYHINIISTI